MTAINLNRLRWQCRRGMLELDVCFQRFLDQAFSQLSLEDQQCFVRLLEEEDQQLFFWITGRETPRDPAFARMIEQVRHYAASLPHA